MIDYCGIMNYLLPGDIVLADRGFNISESVGMMQARLHIPSFTKGKDQFSALEVEETRNTANVRIHVERVIGAVRQRYTILKGIDFIIKRNQEDTPLVDRIIRVCCVLNNMCDSVPFVMYTMIIGLSLVFQILSFSYFLSCTEHFIKCFNFCIIRGTNTI